jgi:cytochrome P450
MPQGNDKTFFLVTCGSAEISTRDRELAIEIARRPHDFRQPKLNGLVMGKFGPNVVTENGESWAKQRKVIASVVNDRISKAVFGESIRQTDSLLAEVYDNADGQNSDTNQLFDMMKKITINVLSGAGMGASVDWRSDANDQPRKGYKMTYIETCKIVIDAIIGPIILPQWLLKNWPRFLPGHEYLTSLGQAIEEFPLHTKHLIEQERQRASAHGVGTKSNIMSQLLQASEGDVKASKALSEDEVLSNLFIFTAAGFETTANTLSYALVLLCRYPEWQDWMLEEIDSLIPSDSNEPVDYVTIFPRVVRIMAIMLETLRLYVPVVHLFKETTDSQSVETSRGTYNIPANCTIYVSVVGVQLDPEVWRDLNQHTAKDEADGGLSDEYAFRPTRWVNPIGSQTPLFQPPKGSYLPWSAGPRVCPGQKMAQVEFTAIFLTLFRRHRIEAVPLEIDGCMETSTELNARLNTLMSDSISMLTLMMQGVYDVGKEEIPNKGLKIRFSKRR